MIRDIKKTVVVINEQHKMLPAQIELLPENFEELKVPAKGWTIREMNKQIPLLEKCDIVVFISPIPYMIRQLGFGLGYAMYDGWKPYPEVKLFHNDKRDKHELPNGQVIMKVAKEGWKLV